MLRGTKLGGLAGGVVTSSFISAVAVGVVGSAYARFTRRHPLSIVITGMRGVGGH